ncbi:MULTISPECIES: hypothetical protein [Methylobacterium]|jgi:hypothetical protein|uniref:UrcA family protein n=1 Tax=Methylobacterium longum TaxID=767694 RepID=A0ABT8AJZ3_9HYPH|nr:MULTISPECIES: hypothetical protein [Methylobacterium]MCJ2101156.1 hypothetical protein [Methylobacterium sp. E-046]MDN3570078.1 hypothetical protein [Methylobacterium longum]GJE14414.1 hypothetical protein FOHLNKBM_5489 [Methylobacterium longum]
MPAYRILAALALAAGLAGPVLAQGDSTCARDLLVAQSMQRQAIDQLEQVDSDDAKTCRVWRRHVETMRRVASVYGRCLSGSERGERLAQVQGSDREFSAAIKARCKGS